eukprot:1156484-Pelagomonas_calceolata.AAC.16
MIHGLPFGYDTNMVKDMMKPLGGILNAHVFKDNLGRNKGYGLVCFDRYARMLGGDSNRLALVHAHFGLVGIPHERRGHKHPLLGANPRFALNTTESSHAAKDRREVACSASCGLCSKLARVSIYKSLLACLPMQSNSVMQPGTDGELRALLSCGALTSVLLSDRAMLLTGFAIDDVPAPMTMPLKLHCVPLSACSPEAAAAAIEKYNGQELHGRPLSVGPDKKLM